MEARIHFAGERRNRSLVAEEEAGSSGIHCCRRNNSTLRLGSPWLRRGVCLSARNRCTLLLMRAAGGDSAIRDAPCDQWVLESAMRARRESRVANSKGEVTAGKQEDCDTEKQGESYDSSSVRNRRWARHNLSCQPVPLRASSHTARPLFCRWKLNFRHET
jgi:hypothetical protein